MRWALSTLRHWHSTSQEWQCTFDDHGGAVDAVFVSMVVSAVLVTKLAMEVKVTFQMNVVQPLSSLGVDDWVNRIRSLSSLCVSHCEVCTEEVHTYGIASPSLARPSAPILTLVVLIVSVRPRFTLL